jgi:hypothetical protein
MLAVDLRFPNPKPFRREFIELIWGGGIGEGGRRIKRHKLNGCGRVIGSTRFRLSAGGRNRRRRLKEKSGGGGVRN